MNFLFPKFSTPTHIINNSIAISIDYPRNNFFRTKRDYQVPEGAQVAVIQENLGFKCEWSQVKVIDPLYQPAEYFDKPFYILNEYITSINSKKTFKAICTPENEIDINAQEIDPTLKDTFIPYIDKKNGLYSVRIQTDYEKILDAYIFEKLLQEVFYEGMSLLLASRGFRSDNDTITSFLNEYNTFGYINKDLDLTVLRPCEPITFTVSLPLRFFNNFEENSLPSEIREAPRKIKFKNKNFVELINNILFIFKKRAEDFFSVTYPNKFIENFNIDYEIVRIKNFAKAINNFFGLAGFSILSDNVIDYEIGFDITRAETLKLLYIKVIIDGKETYLSQSFLSQFRMTGELNTLRIFNYILNSDNMKRDVNQLEILDFIKLYIKYPNANLVDEKIVIGGQQLTPEKIKSYREDYKNLKKCVNVRDLASGINEGIRFADTIYYLFVENEEQKEIKTPYEELKQKSEDLKSGNAKTNKADDTIRRRFIEDGQIIYYPETLKDTSQFAELTKISNISTLSYMLNRMNITKFLLQHMFCYLRGLPPNSREAIEFSQRISLDLINYFTYLYNIRKYRGAKFAQLVADGAKNFDYDLFCNGSEQVIYFIKALSAITKGLNIIGTQLVNIKNELANKKTVNPYTLLTNQVILTIQNAYSDYLTNLMGEMFSNSCEDDLLNPSPNFQDPFKTHIPIENNGRTINNDEQTIKNNTKDALDETFAGGVINNLVFGFDREYAVDLLQKLFDDIKCILTPNEIIDLLQNKANDLTIVLIKNIIRNKYAEDPNNLLFLIENDQALKLFFQKFGQKIDPVILENIETTIGDANELVGTSLCKDEFADTRKKIIEGKLPPELGVLEDQISRRVKRARNVLEYVTNDTAIINVAALCPEDNSDQANVIKDNILENYNNYINNLFSDVLTSFNENASLSGNKLLETKSYGLDSNIKKYLSAYPTFSFNFEGYIQGTFLLNNSYNTFYDESKTTQQFSNKFALGLIYAPDSREINSQENLNRFVKISKDEAIKSFVFCEDKNYEASEEFIKYITRNAFYTEFVREDYFFDEEGDLDDSRTDFTRQEKIDKGIVELQDRRYFISITFDKEYGDFGSDDIIQFRLYQNDTANKKYNIIKTVKFQGEIEGYTFKTTDSIRRTFNFIIKTQEGITLNPGWEPDNDKIYKLQFYKTEDNSLIQPNQNIPVGTKIQLSFDPARIYSQFLNDVFNLYFKDEINQLEKFSELSSLIDKFKKFGLFQNFISFDPEKDNLNQKILVSTTVSKEEIELKEFIKISIPAEEKDFFKNLFKSLIYSNISQGKILETSNPPSSDLYTQFFKNTIDTQLLVISHEYSKFIKTKLLDKVLLSSSDENEAVRKYNDDENYRNILTKNGSKSVLLNFSNDSRYKRCNIFPHYLNLEFFKQRAFNNAKELLCDDYLRQAPEDIIKEIIVNMTVRTFVTDILTRNLIFLNLLSKETLEKLHTNKYFFNIIFQFFKKELQTYGTRQDDTTVYYEKFLKIVEEVFDKYLNNGILYGINDNSFVTIKKEFLENKNCYSREEKLFYFVRKEIRHFIYYSLAKEIITPSEIDIYKEFIDSNSSYSGGFITISAIEETLSDILTTQVEKEKFLNINPEQREKTGYNRGNAIIVGPTAVYDLDKEVDSRRPTYSNYTVAKNAVLEWFGFYEKTETVNVGAELQFLIKNKYTEKLFEYLFFFYSSHFLMANTIDGDKRSLFSSTKTELVTLLYQLIPFSEEENPQGVDLGSKNQEDIIQFLRNLSYAPNPAVFINTAPEYAKYVDFYLKALLTTTRTILGTVAGASDPNIAVTKTINSTITTLSSIAWSLTDRQTRQKLIVESTDYASVLLWKKLEDGRALIPDVFISLSLAPVIPYTQPLLSGLYLAVDYIAEGVYINSSFEDIKKLREQYDQENGQKLDPCEPNINKTTPTNETQPICTPEIQQKLKNEVNSYEELPKNKEEIITKPLVC